jgi:putative intracellular protease/amidase
MKYNLTLMLLITFLSNSSNAQEKKNFKVLFVVTSHSQLGSTGEKTGIWIEEFATPYYALKDKGIAITVASPKGGSVPVDPKSNTAIFSTESTKLFYSDAAAQSLLVKTSKLSKVKEDEYDAVFYPGGHGPMWDLAEDKVSARLIESFYNNNKPIAFVCHAPAALKNVKNKDRHPLIKGKKVSAFTNTEEEAVKLTSIVPFSLENMLKDKGAIYVKGEDWKPFAVKDGLLITGQNPASAGLVAVELLKLLDSN